MVQDCSLCGLVNPPSAQRCDCGFDFASGRVVGTYLSSEQVARARDARLPDYKPTDYVEAVMLLVITGTNGRGACLTLIALCVGGGVGAVSPQAWWVHVAAFGLTALPLDLLARRWFKQSFIDVDRGSQFSGLPVWMVGVAACVIALPAFLAQVL